MVFYLEVSNKAQSLKVVFSFDLCQNFDLCQSSGLFSRDPGSLDCILKNGVRRSKSEWKVSERPRKIHKNHELICSETSQ